MAEVAYKCKITISKNLDDARRYILNLFSINENTDDEKLEKTNIYRKLFDEKNTTNTKYINKLDDDNIIPSEKIGKDVNNPDKELFFHIGRKNNSNYFKNAEQEERIINMTENLINKMKNKKSNDDNEPKDEMGNPKPERTEFNWIKFDINKSDKKNVKINLFENPDNIKTLLLHISDNNNIKENILKILIGYLYLNIYVANITRVAIHNFNSDISNIKNDKTDNNAYRAKIINAFSNKLLSELNTLDGEIKQSFEDLSEYKKKSDIKNKIKPANEKSIESIMNDNDNISTYTHKFTNYDDLIKLYSSDFTKWIDTTLNPDFENNTINQNNANAVVNEDNYFKQKENNLKSKEVAYNTAVGLLKIAKIDLNRARDYANKENTPLAKNAANVALKNVQRYQNSVKTAKKELDNATEEYHNAEEKLRKAREANQNEDVITKGGELLKKIFDNHNLRLNII